MPHTGNGFSRLRSLGIGAVFILGAGAAQAGPCRGAFSLHEVAAIVMDRFAAFAPPSLDVEPHCVQAPARAEGPGDVPVHIAACWWHGFEGSTRSEIVLMPDDTLVLRRDGQHHRLASLCAAAPM
jgi:hypothetical protein